MRENIAKSFRGLLLGAPFMTHTVFAHA